MHLETETKKLEQKVELLLKKLTEVCLHERTARLHEVVESQADRCALNKQQEQLVQLQQSDFPSNFVHPRWGEEIHPKQPEELSQQEWNSKQNQQRRFVSPRSTASLCEYT
jgi:hypothetical protein